MTTLTLKTQLFTKAMVALARIVERSNTIPILSHVLIEKAAGGGITLRATDLDIEATLELDSVNDGQHASFCPPAHLLHDILRKLPEGQEVILKAEGSRASLVCGRSRFALHLLPPEDFPHLENGDDFPVRFSLPAKDLRSLLASVIHAISTEETRYYLNGVFLCAKADQLVAVTTDGHQLAKNCYALPHGAETLSGIIVPRKTAVLLLQLLDGETGEVECAASDKKIRFEWGQMRLTSKLIDGTFPDYERVVPTEFKSLTRFKKAALASSLDLVGTMTNTGSRAVKLDVTGEGIVLSKALDGNEAEDFCQAQIEGEAAIIGLNSTYLNTALKVATGEDITLSFNDGASPVRVMGDDQNLTLIIMPLRA